MITPSFGLTATERVLPRLALDWTTGLAQPGVDVTRAGVATFVGSDGLIQSASADTQRIDYSTGTAGLLVEESRTNLTTYSEAYDGNWSTNSLSFGEQGTAPDGTTSAEKLVPDAETAAHWMRNLVSSITSGTTYAKTFFAKAGERLYLQIANSAGFSSSYQNFNLSNGTLGSGSGFVSADIKPFGDGWYRCVITATATSTTATGGFIICVVNGPGVGRLANYTGNGSDGLYVWGAQLEAGAFPTSYIPTTTTAVTRNADVATMTGTNFSDWFNPSEGTFAIASTMFGTSINRDAMYVSDGTNDNAIGIRWASGSQAQYIVRVNASNEAAIQPSGYSTLGQLYNRVAAYKTDSFQQAINGVSVGTDTSGAVPAVDRLYFGASFNGTVGFSGHIHSFYYYPQRLISNEVVAFSK